MSDENEPTGSGNREPDRFLSALVDLAEQGRIGLTLVVGGVVVSGLTATTKEYFDNVGRTAAEAMRVGGAKDADLGEKAFQSFGKTPNPRYIHLQNAIALTPVGRVPTEGGWYRIRVDRIDGYSFGAMNVG